MDIENLHKRIHICRRCPLHKNVKPPCTPLPGEGNFEADWFFVTKSTRNTATVADTVLTLQEDFAFSTLLKAVGIEKSNTFVSAMLKCPMPTQEYPRVSHIDACTDFLREEIRIVRPKVIVCLGRNATRWFLRGMSTRVLPELYMNELGWFDDIPIYATMGLVTSINSKSNKTKQQYFLRWIKENVMDKK